MSSHRQSKSHVLTWLLCVLGAVAVYLLSVAPVKSMYTNGQIAEKHGSWLSKVYAPAEWILYGTALREPMLAYENWWMKALAPRD